MEVYDKSDSKTRDRLFIKAIFATIVKEVVITRINVVPVKELCNSHLHAEWREAPRLVKNLQTSLNRKGKPFSEAEISPKYLLGTGHIRFFYNKFKYLHERHKELTKELLLRGYKLSYTDSDIFATVDKKWYNDYTPTKEALELNRQRIKERLPKNAKWTTKEKTSVGKNH